MRTPATQFSLRYETIPYQYAKSADTPGRLTARANSADRLGFKFDHNHSPFGPGLPERGPSTVRHACTPTVILWTQ
jgi:hypothetical protein